MWSGWPADRLIYARAFGAIAIVIYALVGGFFIPPLAALSAIVALATAAVMYRLEKRRGRPYRLLEYPRGALFADLLAATLGMIAASPNPRSVGFMVVISVGAFTVIRLGRTGFIVTAVAFAFGRVASEAWRIAAGQPTPVSQLVADVMIAALTLGLLGIVIEAYRHEQRRAERALERAHMLEDVAVEISGETDPARVLQSLPAMARQVVDVDHAALIVRRGDEFEIIAGSGTAERVVGVRAHATSGAVGEVGRTRRTVVLDDYSIHPTAPQAVKAIGLHPVLAVPIYVHGGIAAVLMVGRLARVPFRYEEVRAVEGFASHAAIALANARQLEQTRRLEAVSRAAAEDAPSDVLTRIGRELYELLACEWALVTELSEGRSRPIAALGLAADVPDEWVPYGPITQRLVVTKALVVIPDYLELAAEFDRSRRPVARRAVEVGIRATIAAPVIVDGRVRVALAVGTTDPHRTFDEFEQRGLLAFAESAATALRAGDAREERERRIRRLSVLNELAWELAQVRDVLRVARLVHKACGELVRRDAFYIARYDDARKLFHFLFQEDEGKVEESEFAESWDGDMIVPLGTGPTSQVVLSGRTYVVHGASDHVQHAERRFGDRSRPSASAVHVPLKLGDRVVGVLSAQSYVPKAYDDEDIEVLQSLGNLAASAFANVEHLERGRELYLASVRALAAAVDARDPYTRSHSARVAALSRLIAEELALPADEIRRVQLGALLHDIGKIGIPDAILNKPAALTAEEWVIMRTHSALGASIVAAVEPLKDLVPIVRAHHERHDGTGYPDGLKGDEIPLAAGIVSVADAFEVIVSKRAYKSAQTVDFAIGELLRCRGTQFAPQAVDAFLRIVERDRVHGTQRIRRVREIEHEDIEDVPGPGEVLERYVARSQTHTRQLAILQRLASEISAVLDIDELAARLLRIVCDAMGYEHGFLLTLAEDDSGLVVRAAVGPSKEYVGTSLPRGQGISWWVIENGELQNVSDVHKDTRYVGPGEIRSTCIVPLRMGEERVGVLGIESTTDAAFGQDDEELLTAVSHQIAAAIRVARLHAEAKTAASTDALTSLSNRRTFFERLSFELRRAGEGMPLSVAIVDVDLLKETNDRHGHHAGDEALARIAALLASGVRAGDLVARIGGDEFGIVFPGAGQLVAERVMRRLALTIAETSTPDGRPLPTVSFGVASADAPDASVDSLIDTADQAMYRHKQLTRGRATSA